MDYYQILGVKRSCDRKTLHQAFRELSKKKHPDRYDEASRRQAEKDYQQIVVAFNTLKDDRLRAKYDKSLAAPQKPRTSETPDELSKKYHNAGVQRYNQGQHEAAVDCFKRAVHYRDNAESHYYKGLAESQLPRLRKDAVSSLQAAVQKNGRNPKYHLQLAKTLLEFGLKVRAKAVIDKALPMFPNNRELVTLARELEPQTASKKGGLLGGIFGK